LPWKMMVVATEVLVLTWTPMSSSPFCHWLTVKGSYSMCTFFPHRR
jgi:hypothetical protein